MMSLKYIGIKIPNYINFHHSVASDNRLIFLVLVLVSMAVGHFARMLDNFVPCVLNLFEIISAKIMSSESQSTVSSILQ